MNRRANFVLVIWLTSLSLGMGQDAKGDTVFEGRPLSQWLKDLSSEKQAVHDKADKVLTAAGKNLLPALVKLINHGEMEVRVQVIDMIGVIGEEGKEAIPALVQALEDPAAQVRGAAAETLGSFGELAKDHVPTLIKMIKDEKKNGHSVRARIAKGLGAIGPDAKDAVNPLITILEIKESAKIIQVTICVPPLFRRGA